MWGSPALPVGISGRAGSVVVTPVSTVQGRAAGAGPETPPAQVHGGSRQHVHSSWGCAVEQTQGRKVLLPSWLHRPPKAGSGNFHGEKGFAAQGSAAQSAAVWPRARRQGARAEWGLGVCVERSCTPGPACNPHTGGLPWEPDLPSVPVSVASADEEEDEEEEEREGGVGGPGVGARSPSCSSTSEWSPGWM